MGPRRSLHQTVKRIVDKKSQKTKVRAIVSLLGFAGGATQASQLAIATGSARSNMSDVSVPAFCRIQVMHFDLIVYQSGSAVAADGFVDWNLSKSPGGTANYPSPLAPTVGDAGYIFLNGRAGVPMMSALGAPFAFHIVGTVRIPPRFQLMSPNDLIQLQFRGLAGTNVTYSVNGVVNYMYKI